MQLVCPRKLRILPGFLTYFKKIEVIFSKVIFYRFKLFSQLIVSFMQQQIFAEREIRLSSDAAVTNSKIQYVKSLRNQKQYASYVGSIDLASEYLSDTNKTFVDAYELFSKLVLTMYNEKFLIDKLQL